MHHQNNTLVRHLGVRDLTAFGIAAIIGAGSFSSLGDACFKGGPGVIILFIICGISCAFTALCYSEFASRIPASGSAYTYAYASFGEIFAWIIGWALIMEYSIGNIYVAYSWSDYFTSFLSTQNIHIPNYLSCSYLEAQKAFENQSSNLELITAWTKAPNLFGLKIIFDLPAFLINIFITILVYRGVKESRNFSNIMVVLKLAIIVLVIVVGAFYINFENWMPLSTSGQKQFMPNGFSGVMAAVSGVFFAFIGFDAVSVMAEESKNPQKDLPRGMLASLIICTILYIILTLVLTGVADYRSFEGVGDPLAKIFEIKHVAWMQFLVSICAVIAMTSVLLVFQMGQPRIWLSMSRDGLLPPAFQKVSEKYKTPSFATIITGMVVGLPILFTDKSFILDFTSIATIFAFVLVCGGVLLIPRRSKTGKGFHLPFINSQWIMPILSIVVILLILIFNHNYFVNLFNFKQSEIDSKGNSFEFLKLVTPQLLLIKFWIVLIVISVFCFIKKWSLIPVLGLVTGIYLLTGMSLVNWLWFLAWLAVGLIIYRMYGYKNSKLHPSNHILK